MIAGGAFGLVEPLTLRGLREAHGPSVASTAVQVRTQDEMLQQVHHLCIVMVVIPQSLQKINVLLLLLLLGVLFVLYGFR